MPKKKGKGKGKGEDPSLRPKMIRDALKKETTNMVLNDIKLKDNYRVDLRAIRCNELKEELEALRRTFERRNQDLNHAVERFSCDVQHVESLSAQMWRLHHGHIERLRAMQEKRLMFLHQQWNTGHDIWDHNLELLSEKMGIYFLQSRMGFEDTVVHLERHHQQSLAIVHMLYSEPMEGHSVYEKRKAFEVEECFLDQNVKVLKNQKAEKRYLQDLEKLQTMEAKKQVSVTTSKKGVTLYNTVLEVQARLEATGNNNSGMVGKLTAARNEAKAKIHMLLKRMARNRVSVHTMIHHMSMRSHSATNNLRMVIAKGAQLLKVAEMCRHLEAMQMEEQWASEEAALRSAEGLIEPSLAYEFPELMNRYNVARIHRMVLERRQEDLRKEKRQLQQLQDHRCQIKTIKSDTHKGAFNPLLVKMAPVKKKGSTKPFQCVIEGVHAIRILAIHQSADNW
ncbi:dynein regulatory complex subunit 2-like [Stigmatopora argus]